jgi:hypothetical protein
MRWSKLRKQIKDNIVTELRDRIDVHTTRYRDSHDEVSEAWITVDKKKVCTAGYYRWMNEAPSEFDGTEDGWIATGTHADFTSAISSNPLVLRLQQLEIHHNSHLTGSLFNYLNTSVEASLISTNPFYKAFAIVDRRIGKRRVNLLEVADDEHSLVRLFYALRIELS